MLIFPRETTQKGFWKGEGTGGEDGTALGASQREQQSANGGGNMATRNHIEATLEKDEGADGGNRQELAVPLRGQQSAIGGRHKAGGDLLVCTTWRIALAPALARRETLGVALDHLQQPTRHASALLSTYTPSPQKLVGAVD